MAGKELESTMKYKVDISDLKASMTQARREIKLSNAEFKNAVAGMDDWGSSADGVGAKLRNLDKNIDAQKSILKDLEQQYAMVCEEQGETSKGAQELLIKIENQSATVKKTEKQRDKYRQQLDEIKATSKESDTEIDKLNKTISEQEQELQELKSAYQESALNKGKDADATKELGQKIADLSADLQSNKDKMKDAAYAGDDLSDALDDAGDSADRSEGGFTVLKGAIASLAADAIRAAIDGFKELATESERASASFSASTGISTEKMEAYNDQMKELYKNNYGDSLDDIAESMAEVKQQTNELDPTKLKDMTKNAIALRDTFGWDIQESMRAVKMLMDQFGISAEEAYNLMAQGAQNGLDKNGDLLDSINEYAVHYEQMGYSAEEFFNSLENGTLSGTFSVDKLGDAMKEFGIRTKDTATTTTEGFELLGLDADKMRDAFVKGGDAARDATDKTINALFSMDDQVKQNQAGVDLFGTMWEDLGKDGVQSLMMVNGSADKTKKTMQEINKVKYSDVGNQFKELGRSVKTDLLMPIAEKLLPIVKGFVTWTIENLPTIIPIVETVGAALTAAFAVKTISGFKDDIVNVGGKLVDLSEKVPLVGNAFNAIGGFISANPWLILAAAIAGVTLAIGGFLVKSAIENDEHRKNIEAIEGEIKSREDLKKTQDEQLATNLGEIENTQSLYNELQNLVDVNGKVKEGYESRVSFILNELNQALGTEMELNNGTISGYKDLSDSIENMIAKKRAEIIVEAQLPAYKEAVTKSIEAQAKANELSAEISANNAEATRLEIELLKKYGEGWTTSYEAMSSSLGQQWSQLEADTYKKETEYNKQNTLLKGYHEDIDSYEINSMRLMSGKPEEIAKIETDVAAVKSGSYAEQKEMLQAQMEFEKGSLDSLKKKYDETGDETLLSMIKSKEQKIKNMQEELDGLHSTVDEKKPGVVGTFADMAKKMVNSLDKKEESKTKGKENAEGYASGARSKRSSSYNAGGSLVEGMLSGIGGMFDDVNKKGKAAGGQFKSGADSVSLYSVGKNYAIGLSNGVWAIDIVGMGRDIGNAIKRGTMAALDEHSPSKEGEKIMDFYMQGLGIGTNKNMYKVLDPVDNMGKSLISKTRQAAEEASNVLSNAFTGVSDSNTMVQGRRQIALASGTQSYQPLQTTFVQNNYSPKSLSRREIYQQTKNALRFKDIIGGTKK